MKTSVLIPLGLAVLVGGGAAAYFFTQEQEPAFACRDMNDEFMAEFNAFMDEQQSNLINKEYSKIGEAMSQSFLEELASMSNRSTPASLRVQLMGQLQTVMEPRDFRAFDVELIEGSYHCRQSRGETIEWVAYDFWSAFIEGEDMMQTPGVGLASYENGTWYNISLPESDMAKSFAKRAFPDLDDTLLNRVPDPNMEAMERAFAEEIAASEAEGS